MVAPTGIEPANGQFGSVQFGISDGPKHRNEPPPSQRSHNAPSKTLWFWKASWEPQNCHDWRPLVRLDAEAFWKIDHFGPLAGLAGDIGHLQRNACVSGSENNKRTVNQKAPSSKHVGEPNEFATSLLQLRVNGGTARTRRIGQ